MLTFCGSAQNIQHSINTTATVLHRACKVRGVASRFCPAVLKTGNYSIIIIITKTGNYYYYYYKMCLLLNLNAINKIM